MADHAAAVDDGGEDIFIYMGGIAPQHDVTRVRIDKSVTMIDDEAFRNNRNLLEVETHEGITTVGKQAFDGCFSLRGIQFPGVEVIKGEAFKHYSAMSFVNLVTSWKQSNHLHFSTAALLGVSLFHPLRLLKMGRFPTVEVDGCGATQGA